MLIVGIPGKMAPKGIYEIIQSWRKDVNWMECSECQKKIYPGEPCWSVNIHREMVEEGMTTTVIEATGALVYCEDCASKRDFGQIAVPFK